MQNVLGFYRAYFLSSTSGSCEKHDVNHLWHSLHSPQMVFNDRTGAHETGHINVFMAMDLYRLNSIFLPRFSTFLLN